MRLNTSFHRTLMLMYTLFIYPVYHSHFGLCLTTECTHEYLRQLLAGSERWPNILDTLHLHWKGACGASVVFLQVSVALLQIDSVLCNVVLRSMAMAVGIFSLTGLAIGGIFLASKRTMSDIQFRASWTEASIDATKTSAIDFWVCISLPVVSAIWSITLCALIILFMCWMEKGGMNNAGRNCTSGFGSIASVVITTLLGVNITLAYRAAKLVWLR